MMQQLMQNEYIVILIKTLLAFGCGSLLGRNRKLRGKDMGQRTYSIVCVASMLSMATGLYLAKEYGTDPARIAAQVVSGISFLGAGTILMGKDNHILGLTTAASLWASACLGLAIGAGFYAGALAGFIAIYLVLSVEAE